MGNKKRIAQKTNKKVAAAKTEKVLGSTQKSSNTPVKARISRKTLTVIISVALVLLITAGIVFGVFYSAYNTRFDYMKDDIARYIKLDRSDYAGYDINVTVTEPTELELEERILQILADNKPKTPLYNGYYVTPLVPLENGWVVNIWYRGYTYDEHGNEVEFDGGCNFTSTTAKALELGSGDFISGFEIGLIGKNITEYSKFTVTTSGVVDDEDIAVVNMLAMFPDGSSEICKQKRIDLSAPNVDEIWGEGFKEALVGKTIGDELSEFITEMEDGTAVYTDIKIISTVKPTRPHTTGEYSNGDKITVEYKVTRPGEDSETKKTSFTLNEYVIGGNFGGEMRELMYSLLGGGTVGVAKETSFTDSNGVEYSSPKVVSVERREDKPIVVEAYFPYDYSEESLRGKKAYFDVYVDGAIIYETPKLTEAFITETLKLSAESLAEYDGDGIVEKYRAKIWAELTLEYNEKLEAQIEELVWARLSKRLVCDYDKLPVGEVRAVKAEYTSDFMEYYEGYKSVYASINDAALDYFGISGDGSLWKEYVDAVAREDIAQKMVLYYIARQESFLPDIETLDGLYKDKVEELLTEYLTEKHCEREDFDTEEEYLAAVEKHRADMIEEYGEKSIFDALCYEIVVPKLKQLANVKKP